MRMTFLQTPAGEMVVAERDGMISNVWFDRQAAQEYALLCETPLLRETARQLAAYFTGERLGFSLPLEPARTPFMQQVREALCSIPYGETATYGEIARQVGRPGAARAVGMANHRNPLPVIVPCHRVIGGDGRLVGYRGGLGLKSFLLDLEQRVFSR